MIEMGCNLAGSPTKLAKGNRLGVIFVVPFDYKKLFGRCHFERIC
jgi:hypothetical protein